GIWIGLVANAHSNSFTRIVFPDSLTGVPVATNSGIVPGVDYPTSIYPILENDSCYAIVTSRSSNEIFRFNFGDSYMNNMMIVNNLGDIGALNEPFDVAVIRDCDGVFGLVTSRYHMTKVNMPGGVGGLYDGDTLFATGLNRPEGISNAIRQNDSLYFLLANAGNRLTVLAFPTSQGTYPNYFGNNPFNITFSNIGTMPVSLFLNEGEYNQIIECVDVEVIPEPLAPSLQFINDTIFATPSTGIIWFFNGQVIPNYHQDYLVPAMPGQYYAVINNGYCSSSSSIIIDISGIQNDPSSKFSCKGYFAENMLIVEMQCQTAMDAQVELFDITGKKLLTSNRISGNRLSIAANNISKGVYIISVHTLTGSSKCKIVKWM
ncbi:MAG: T9SS type A sorting domain-containing protein, partial [Bacteroidota bacterium]